MTTMYIAADNCIERGYFTGDVYSIVKSAKLFVENEPHDNVILSICRDDILNYIWHRFIRENNVTVIYDDLRKGDQKQQYQIFDERRLSRKITDIPFDTYKELYTRMDGGMRQHILCGKERGLGASNIFEYFYYGQETCKEPPIGSTIFAPDIIDIPQVDKLSYKSVFIAPHEKCHGNTIFTHRFWQNVVEKLLENDVHICLNDRGSFCSHIKSPLLSYSFVQLDQLPLEVAKQQLVLCGNTGIGWVAGAVGTDLIACEKSRGCWDEYSFKRCGVTSLIDIVSEPNVEHIVQLTIDYFKEKF